MGLPLAHLPSSSTSDFPRPTCCLSLPLSSRPAAQRRGQPVGSVHSKAFLQNSPMHRLIWHSPA